MSIEESIKRLKGLVRDRYPNDPLNAEVNGGIESQDLTLLFSRFSQVDGDVLELLRLRSGETISLFPPFVLFSVSQIISNFGQLIDL